MDPLALKAVIQEVEGRWVGGSPPPEVCVADVVTDSRTLSDSSLFVALEGENGDGHAFVGEARRRGAVASVVRHTQLSRLPPSEGPYIAVDEPLAALERMGVCNRRLANLSIVGVTGSVGKTSTKEFLATILAADFRVQAAPKSFNNRLGVALTLISAKRATEVLVVELATSGPGELAHLSRLVQPERVVVTEIGASHLAGLGDIDGVAEAKAEVLEGLASDGGAFINRGIYGFERFRERLAGRRLVSYGWAEAPADGLDFSASCCRPVALRPDNGSDAAESPYGYEFAVNETETFVLPLPGRHNVLNALGAVAVARDFGMSWESIRGGLTQCRLPPWRGQIVSAGEVFLFDDSYNANPASMTAAIREWQAFGETVSPTGRQASAGGAVAVLGDMLELGSGAQTLHEEVGRQLAAGSVRLLVTVGNESEWIRSAYRQKGGPALTAHFSTGDDATEFLRDALLPGDWVLFKGSRRIGLDRVSAALRRSLSAAGPAKE